MHAAIYDAVVGIAGGYEPYTEHAVAPEGASADAAAAQAAHDVLVGLFPAQQAQLDAVLAVSLARVPDGQAEDDGVLYGRQVPIDILALRQNDNLEYAGSRLLGAVRDSAAELYLADTLGSTRAVLNAAGDAVGRSDYRPFGETSNDSGNLPAQRFTGQERDEEGGLDYFNARMYQPRHGRFTTVDPVFLGLLVPQGWNRYSYALSGPTTFVDPSGAAPTATFRVEIVGLLGQPCTTCHFDFSFEWAGEPEEPRDPGRVGLGYDVPIGTSVAGQPGANPGPAPDPIPPTTDPDDSRDPQPDKPSVLWAQCKGFAQGARDGAAAYVDGFIPLADPLAEFGAYDPNGAGLGFSNLMGEIGSLLVGASSGLRGGANLSWGASRGWRHALNHNRYVRTGYTKGMRADRLWTPTLRIGTRPPSKWNHFDLTVCGR